MPEKELGLMTIDDEIYKMRLTPDAREELTTECEVCGMCELLYTVLNNLLQYAHEVVMYY